MRVPPKRSSTAALASSIATCTSRWARIGVSRRERGGEGEHLGVGGVHRCPHEVEVHGGVGLHRLAHVAEHQQAAGAFDPTPADELDRLPVGPSAPGDRLPRIDAGCPTDGARRAASDGGATDGRPPPATPRAAPRCRDRAARRACRRSPPGRWATVRAPNDRPGSPPGQRAPSPRAASPTGDRRRLRPRHPARWAGRGAGRRDDPAAAAGHVRLGQHVGLVEDGREHQVEGGQVGAVADEGGAGQPVEAGRDRWADTPTTPG